MKNFIYKSDFKVGPEATKKNDMLFKADLAFAISEGYGYIQPKEGPVFAIVDSNTIIEVDVTEEELQAAATLSNEPTEVEFDPTETEEEYCISCHNLMLIDQIINNTLSQDSNITPQQADTMLKLAQLSILLQGEH